MVSMIIIRNDSSGLMERSMIKDIRGCVLSSLSWLLVYFTNNLFKVTSTFDYKSCNAVVSQRNITTQAKKS